jgi:hypothetical protein
MVAGSAFDVEIKAYLATSLNAGTGTAVRGLETAVSDPGDREWAKGAGAELMGLYVKTGALAGLMHELSFAATVRLETGMLRGVVESNGVGVPCMGQPDIWWLTKNGVTVIADWKCNGYMGKSRPSPKPGYVCCYPDGSPHRDVVPVVVDGITLDGSSDFTERCPDEAVQLTFYAWLLGVPVGDSFIGGIDRLLMQAGDPSRGRVARYRMRIPGAFSTDTHKRLVTMWQAIQNLPKERIAVLDAARHVTGFEWL